MTIFATRGALRRTASLALAGTVILGAVQSAVADDSGVHDFFSAMFRGGAAEIQAAPVTPQPSFDTQAVVRRPFGAPRPRSLTVRLRKPEPRVVVSRGVPTKPVKVSIFEDRTLRRGDAVMTAHGIRVFAGSNSWPYAPQDFVSLAEAEHMSQDTSKVLAQLDRAPRG